MPIFQNKHISGMIHLGRLSSEDLEGTYDTAVKDVQALAAAGLDSLLLENWHDEDMGVFNEKKTKNMLEIGKRLAKEVGLPWGINVLPNEWRAAFYIAEQMGAKFVELDVFVDEVIPTEKLEPEVIQEYRQRPEAKGIEFYPMIHPKHREMIDKSKTWVQSACEARKYGADGVVVTGTITGENPEVGKLIVLREDTGKYPIAIGSGLTADNARALLKYADGAMVGTYLKKGGITDNPVDYTRAKKLMDVVKRLR